MKNLEKYIQESFLACDIEEDYVVEGININPNDKTVSLTDEHDKGVDFSLVNNPVYDKYGKYDVISIFKRNKLYDLNDTQRDGNPFLYALKGKYGWKFNISNEEITKYIRRFLEICHKIKSEYDTIVMTPSSTDLNKKFMKVISKQVKSSKVINEFFVKLTKEEIVDDDLIDKEAIMKDYPDSYNAVLAEINRSFRRMKGEHFEAKVMDKKYLKYIKYIGEENNAEDLRQYIDGKDILLLDDTISSGETISQCINGITSNFTPKSVTIITLLSKLN